MSEKIEERNAIREEPVILALVVRSRCRRLASSVCVTLDPKVPNCLDPKAARGREGVQRLLGFVGSS